jgi:hypothetical protein
MITRTGCVAHFSTARLAGMAAATLAQSHPPPQVSNKLLQLFAERHRLIEIGQEIAKRTSVRHLASLVCAYS